MKSFGNSLYVSGLILFVLISAYYVLKGYLFENLDLEEITGVGKPLFILCILTSLLLFGSGIFFIKASEKKRENAENLF